MLGKRIPLRLASKVLSRAAAETPGRIASILSGPATPHMTCRLSATSIAARTRSLPSHGAYSRSVGQRMLNLIDLPSCPKSYSMPSKSQSCIHASSMRVVCRITVPQESLPLSVDDPFGRLRVREFDHANQAPQGHQHQCGLPPDSGRCGLTYPSCPSGKSSLANQRSWHDLRMLQTRLAQISRESVLPYPLSRRKSRLAAPFSAGLRPLWG